jgi:regulator of extracellular matrix RemA (YlzA/DUF370 family)
MKRAQPETKPYLWWVGEGGLVAPQHILAAGLWGSAPIRRAARRSRADGRLIDLTFGKACIWVLFLDSGHLVLATEPMPAASFEDAEADRLIIERHGEV